jgi:hypothetical protein
MVIELELAIERVELESPFAIVMSLLRSPEWDVNGHLLIIALGAICGNRTADYAETSILE